MASILSQRAMLMTVSLAACSFRKLDKRVTDETNAAHGATSDAGRYNKQLLSKNALAEIAKIDGEIHQYYYLNTSPWLDRNGVRIVSAVKCQEAMSFMRNKRYEREAAIDKFVVGYPGFVADARLHLNGMFSESDYPTPSAVRAKFRFSVAYDNIPDSDDIRIVGLQDAEIEDIRRDVAARSNAAIETIVRDCYQRIAGVVGTMSEKLKAYRPPVNGGDKTEGIFRDSLVGNVRDLVDLLPALNVTGDNGLATIAARMADLCRDDAKELRDNQSTREAVARDADAILSDVSAYLS